MYAGEESGSKSLPTVYFASWGDFFSNMLGMLRNEVGARIVPALFSRLLV